MRIQLKNIRKQDIYWIIIISWLPVLTGIGVFLDILPLACSINALCACIGALTLYYLPRTWAFSFSLLAGFLLAAMWGGTRWLCIVVHLAPQAPYSLGWALLLLTAVALVLIAITRKVQQTQVGIVSFLLGVMLFFLIPAVFNEPLRMLPRQYLDVFETPEILEVTDDGRLMLLASFDRKKGALLDMQHPKWKMKPFSSETPSLGTHIKNAERVMLAVPEENAKTLSIKTLLLEANKATQLEQTRIPVASKRIHFGRNGMSRDGAWFALNTTCLYRLADKKAFCWTSAVPDSIFTGFQEDNPCWHHPGADEIIRFSTVDERFEKPLSFSGNGPSCEQKLLAPEGRWVCEILKSDRAVHVVSATKPSERKEGYVTGLLARDFFSPQWIDSDTLLLITKESALCCVNANEKSVTLLSRLAELVTSVAVCDDTVFYASCYEQHVYITMLPRPCQ